MKFIRKYLECEFSQNLFLVGFHYQSRFGEISFSIYLFIYTENVNLIADFSFN